MRGETKEKIYAKHPVHHINIVIPYVAPEKELKTTTDSPATQNTHLCQTAAPPLCSTLWHSLVQHCSWKILQGERGTNSIQSQRERGKNKTNRRQLGSEREERSRTDTEKNKG